jgi:tRNA A-37 threonylcarbamoyl transferase component Bud32
MEKLPGVTLGAAFARLAASSDSGKHTQLLCSAVADTISRMHDLGVVHGDLHMDNLLVSVASDQRDEHQTDPWRVRILD